MSTEEGVRCGSKILKIKVLGYADDAALVAEDAETMTARLTAIADTSVQEADMVVNMQKTFTQHVHERKEITVTKEEVMAVEAGYEHKCDFCTRRFKTRRGMLIHRNKCPQNYNTTEEAFELDEVIAVFGEKDNRWFKVKWCEHEPD